MNEAADVPIEGFALSHRINTQVHLIITTVYLSIFNHFAVLSSAYTSDIKGKKSSQFICLCGSLKA